MIKNKKQNIDFSEEVKMEDVKPIKFNISEHVTTTKKEDINNVKIPDGIELVVMHALSNNVYILIGPDNLQVRLDGKYLKKVKED